MHTPVLVGLPEAQTPSTLASYQIEAFNEVMFLELKELQKCV